MNKKTAAEALRSTDEPYFNYWQTLTRSFYSKNLYLDVAKRWKKLPLGYLLLLILIVCVPLSIRICLDFNNYINQIIQPLDETPDFLVQRGNLSFDKPMPFFIRNAKNEVVLIVDANNDTANYPKDYPNLIYLFGKHSIYFRSPPFKFFFAENPVSATETKVVTFDKDTNQVFSGKQLLETNKFVYLKPTGMMIIVCSLILTLYLMILMLLLLLSFLAQLIAQIILKYPARYVETVRLLIVATTPMFFIWFVVFSLNLGVSKLSFTIVIVLSYFCYAVLAIERISKRLTAH